MGTYDKQFKKEAVRLSDEIGVKKAAGQLGIPYYTLADWRFFLGDGSRWIWNIAEELFPDAKRIYEYIAFTLLEPEIAKKQAKRIMEAVAKLNEMPFRCHCRKKEWWRGKGFRNRCNAVAVSLVI